MKCSKCEVEIPTERLEIIPETEVCVNCTRVKPYHCSNRRAYSYLKLTSIILNNEDEVGVNAVETRMLRSFY